MVEYGYNDYTMYIGEHLGNPERERIRQLSLEEASEEVFEHPNNLLLYADTSYKSMQTPCTDLSEFRNHLTRPDAVFIGGHGGKLENILVRLKEVLQPNGCIVFNSVSESSKELFRQGVHAAGMTLHSSLRIIINNFNPIEIMKATI